MTGRMRQSVAEALLALLELVPEEPRGSGERPETEKVQTGRNGYDAAAAAAETVAARMRAGTDGIRRETAGAAIPAENDPGAAAEAVREPWSGTCFPYRVGVPGGMTEMISPLDGDAAETLDRCFRRDSRRYDSGFAGMD